MCRHLPISSGLNKSESEQNLRNASTKYVSLEPFTETKPNLMKIFIGTDTANVKLFFNIVTAGIETFVIPWGQRLYHVP